MSADRPVVRRPDQVAGAETSAGVTAREMLAFSVYHHAHHLRRVAERAAV